MKDLLNFEDVSELDRLAMILALKRIVEKKSKTNIKYLFHYPNELNNDTFYRLEVIDIHNIDYYFYEVDNSLKELQSNFMNHINNRHVDYIVLPLLVNYVDISKDFVYLLIFDKKYISSNNLWVYSLDIFYEDNFFLNKILNHFVRSLLIRDDLVIITNTEKNICPQHDKVENRIDFCVQLMFYFLKLILQNKDSTFESVNKKLDFILENEPSKITEFTYKLIFETINVMFDYRKELNEKNDVLMLSFNIETKNTTSNQI